MISRLRGRGRTRLVLLASIFLLGLLPFGAATANSHRTATRTAITFDAPFVDAVMNAEFTVDDAGIVRVRDQNAQVGVSGDINGTANITFSADFVPDASCDPDDLENCADGWLTGWAAVEISDEAGRWDGTLTFEDSDFENGNYGKLILAGRGGNTGKSIVTDISLNDDGTATFDGFLLTMAKPSFGINLHTQVCFDEVWDAWGAFISTGAIESSGAAKAQFAATDGPWTYRYGVYGTATFTDDLGSITIELTAMAQDNAETKVDWGHWVISSGTGAYENAYGHGKVTGYVGDFAQCSLGQGVWLQYLGQVHFN